MKKIYLLLILLKTSSLFAQPGSLDNSFGVQGVAMSPFITQFSYGHALAIQPDGKLLITGHMDVSGVFRIFVVRYNTNGSFDPSFPNVITSIGGNGEYARAIAVQNDGKIVVAGHTGGSTSDFLVIRLTSSGAYDTTFGTAGMVNITYGLGSIDETNDMVIQPDGKIVIVGWTSTLNKDIALMRFNDNGSVDSTFGVNGRVSTHITNSLQEDGYDVALQPDGKILVAGFSSSSNSANDLLVIRYNSIGSIDSSFGTNGIAMPVLNVDDDAAFAMAVQPDGKIVAAGYTYTNFTYSDNLIVRFDTTGQLDTSFSSTGVVVSNSTNNDHYSTGVIIQPDGKIVVTGRAYNQVTSDFLLSRFNSNGSVDTTFGTAGHVYTNIGIEEDISLASLIQTDGKIVVTGFYTDGGIENFVVARYINDSTLVFVNENMFSNDVLLYPQPASDIMYVWLDKKIKQDVTASIYSINSTLLKTVHGSGEFPIRINDLASGIYFLRITDVEGRAMPGRMFVVE